MRLFFFLFQNLPPQVFKQSVPLKKASPSLSDLS